VSGAEWESNFGGNLALLLGEGLLATSLESCEDAEIARLGGRLGKLGDSLQWMARGLPSL
jgi:hypothetical protein